MREKMAEERRKKLAMLDSKRKRRNTEQTVTTENLDELGRHGIRRFQGFSDDYQ
jgi:hypothetical protein